MPLRIYLGLLLCTHENALFNGVLRDEAVDGDLASLAKAVGTVHGLLVNCGIPVAVVEDDRVSRGQVNAQATSTRRQQEHKNVRPGRWGGGGREERERGR